VIQMTDVSIVVNKPRRHDESAGGRFVLLHVLIHYMPRMLHNY
jgi:hypothetical protein